MQDGPFITYNRNRLPPSCRDRVEMSRGRDTLRHPGFTGVGGAGDKSAGTHDVGVTGIGHLYVILPERCAACGARQHPTESGVTCTVDNAIRIAEHSME